MKNAIIFFLELVVIYVLKKILIQINDSEKIQYYLYVYVILPTTDILLIMFND